MAGVQTEHGDSDGLLFPSIGGPKERTPGIVRIGSMAQGRLIQGQRSESFVGSGVPAPVSGDRDKPLFSLSTEELQQQIADGDTTMPDVATDAIIQRPDLPATPHQLIDRMMQHGILPRFFPEPVAATDIAIQAGIAPPIEEVVGEQMRVVIASNGKAAMQINTPRGWMIWGDVMGRNDSLQHIPEMQPGVFYGLIPGERDCIKGDFRFLAQAIPPDHAKAIMVHERQHGGKNDELVRQERSGLFAQMPYGYLRRDIGKYFSDQATLEKGRRANEVVVWPEGEPLAELLGVAPDRYREIGDGSMTSHEYGMHRSVLETVYYVWMRYLERGGDPEKNEAFRNQLLQTPVSLPLLRSDRHVVRTIQQFSEKDEKFKKAARYASVYEPKMYGAPIAKLIEKASYAPASSRSEPKEGFMQTIRENVISVPVPENPSQRLAWVQESYQRYAEELAATQGTQDPDVVFAAGIALGDIAVCQEKLDDMEQRDKTFLQAARLLDTLPEEDIRSAVFIKSSNADPNFALAEAANVFFQGAKVEDDVDTACMYLAKTKTLMESYLATLSGENQQYERDYTIQTVIEAIRALPHEKGRMAHYLRDIALDFSVEKTPESMLKVAEALVYSSKVIGDDEIKEVSFTAAEAYLMQHLDERPGSSDGLALLGDMVMEEMKAGDAGQYPDSLNMYKKRFVEGLGAQTSEEDKLRYAAGFTGTMIAAATQAGDPRLAEEGYAVARTLLEQATDDKQSAELLNAAGVALTVQNEIEKVDNDRQRQDLRTRQANEYFLRAVVASPDESTYVYNLGETYFTLYMNETDPVQRLLYKQRADKCYGRILGNESYASFLPAEKKDRIVKRREALAQENF